MDEQQAYACLLGNRDRPAHRILEEKGANALSLNGLIDREPCRQHGRIGFLGMPFRARSVASRWSIDATESA
jgi:hypothetical protein